MGAEAPSREKGCVRGLAAACGCFPRLSPLRSRALCQDAGATLGKPACGERVRRLGRWSGHHHPGARPRAGHARVPATRAAGAGGSVTRRQAERAERTGRGGAESSAEQPLPAAAVDPGPGPALWTGARCCSLSRSRCVGVEGRRHRPCRWGGLGKWNSQRLSPDPAHAHSPHPLMHDLGPLPETPGKGEPDQGA